jgi:predicted RNA-binding protein with PUA-like domain
MMAHWLMKSEPESYGWDDLVRDGAADWDGVRNHAARRHLRAMMPGDEAFFYHSGSERAVVGIMRVTGAGKPDGEDGAWVKVPVEPVRAIGPVTLKAIKAEPRLAGMELVRQSRLSVSPVREEEWGAVLALAGGESSPPIELTS